MKSLVLEVQARRAGQIVAVGVFAADVVHADQEQDQVRLDALVEVADQQRVAEGRVSVETGIVQPQRSEMLLEPR